MYPVLYQLGPIKLYTYGLMMALGFLSAIHWATKRAPKYGVRPEFISDLSIWIIVGGIVGGRVGFLAIEESISDVFSFRFFEIWKGGMVFYTGLIGALLAIVYFCRRHRQNFFTVADICAPALALGHFFGRLGCIAAGCCYGKQCELPWAFTFTNPLSLAPLHVPLHPTQAYDAASNLLIILILLSIQRRQKYNGQIFVVYLVLYAIGRSIVEQFRGDTARGFVDFWGLYSNEWLSTSTFVAAISISIALALHFRLKNTPSSLKS